MAKTDEFAVDTPISPRRILRCHLNDEPPDHCRSGWPPGGAFWKSEPGTDTCVAVQGEKHTSPDVIEFQGLASEWRCLTSDPFFLGTDLDFTSGQYALGVVSRDEALPVGLNSPECIDDLTSYPARYLCVAESALDDVVDQIQGAPKADEKVFWIGSEGEVPVEDFDPDRLGTLIFALLEVDGTMAPGQTVTLRTSFTNVGPSPVDSAGWWLRIDDN